MNTTWTVTGTVKYADNSPADDAAVVLTPIGFAATTDASGNFTFSNIPQGNYTIQATKEACTGNSDLNLGDPLFSCSEQFPDSPLVTLNCP